jgi:hypothetical protein
VREAKVLILVLILMGALLGGCCISKDIRQIKDQLNRIEAAPETKLIGFRFVELKAKISSIKIPVQGKLIKTGPISITLAKPGKLGSMPFCVWNLKTRKALVAWPVTVTFPLLKSLGKKSISLTFIGTAFVNQKAKDIFAVGVAVLNMEGLPNIVMCNSDNNKKSDELYPRIYERIEGKLTSVRPGELKQYTLESMIKEAFDLAGVKISQKVLQGFLEQYSKNPLKELVFYFPETGGFQTADLEGTDTLQFIKVPAIFIPWQQVPDPKK